MFNKKIVIAGGTGFIGQGLIRYFGRENEITVLSRGIGARHKNLYSAKLLTKADGFNVRYARWDGKTMEDAWQRELEGCDLLVNLAGRSVNCRYRRKERREILSSRVDSTRALGAAVSRAARPPRVWINESSATIYRDSYDHPNDEVTGIISGWKSDNMPYNVIDHLRYSKNKFLAALWHGKDSPECRETDFDFSVQVCRQWEKAFFDQETPSTRKIALRTAITLGNGGAVVPYVKLCKLGLGGRHGNGNQMFSWVHIEDVERMIEWLFENETASGIYNCVAPEVISNSVFMMTLRQVTRHTYGLPSPAALLEIGAFFLGTETELLLKSRWVMSARAINEGFEFRHKQLDLALSNIISTLHEK